MKIYLGIDPGKSGAYVVLDEHQRILERGELPQIGKMYDVVGLKQLVTKYPYHHIGVEDPGIIHGTSKTSVASLRHCIGLFEGLLIGLGIPHTMCKPKEWQKEMWKDTTKQQKKSSTGKSDVVDTKATSTIVALRLFPTTDWKITNLGNPSKNYNDGMIDAALIAEYIRRMYK